MKRTILTLFLSIPLLIFSQDVELNRINAKDEFKWGVRFFNQGLYEKSVFSFERSLSFDSQDLLTHQWLGNAYFMKGDVDAAMEEWTILKEKDATPLWLEKNMEIISADRGVLNTLYETEEWVSTYNKDIFRPSSLLTMDNGNTAVVSFMENEIIIYNSNGAELTRFTGGFEEFNRPFDIISDGGTGYIVSEFMGDKLSYINDLGIKTKSINPEEEPFSGPGYMTTDGSDYFYVSDWGNRCVKKFDLEGNYILSIKDNNLGRPAGLALSGDRLFVADAQNMKILEFDTSGNYFSILKTEELEAPEGLTLHNKNSLLIADSSKLKQYNLSDGKTTLITDLQGDASKITKGSFDVNGNAVAVDFNLGQFHSLSDISLLYGGLYVVIDRVINRGFPNMEIELQVYNRLGMPVVGLDNSNFLITENSNIVPERDVLFRGSDNSLLDIGLIFDMSSSMNGYSELFYDISTVFEEELDSSDNIITVKAGDIPVISEKTTPSEFTANLSENDFSDRDGIDLSIKLVASSLLQSRKTREIILVTDGSRNNNDFIKYSLNEIEDLLKNNRMTLSIIYVGDERNDELDYLVKESGGNSIYVFDGKGPKAVLEGMRDRRSGYYVVSYESLKNIDNGEVFTSVEVEVNFIRKSGRSESGFFVPVKVVE